jgi:hypothetical protein
MQPGRSLVLMPYGLPQEERHRELCTTLMLRAGGDIDRVIDQPVGELDRFGRHIARIPILRHASSELPIVFLTRTSPLPLTVLNARRVLEGHVPALHGAAWLLFVTDEDDPFFEDGARRLGALSGDLSTCPLWHVPGYPAFVVTSPKLVDPSDVATRIHQLSGAVGATLRTARTLPR